MPCSGNCVRVYRKPVLNSTKQRRVQESMQVGEGACRAEACSGIDSWGA